MSFLVFQRAGADHVSVTTASPKFVSRFASEREAMESLQAQTPGAIIVESVPTSREFRNAWKMQAGAVVEDPAKAREIAKERIERARNRRLDALMRREFRGEDIAAEKSSVMAVNPDSEVSGKPVDDLRGYIPEVLR